MTNEFTESDLDEAAVAIARQALWRRERKSSEPLREAIADVLGWAAAEYPVASDQALADIKPEAVKHVAKSAKEAPEGFWRGKIQSAYVMLDRRQASNLFGATE